MKKENIFDYHPFAFSGEKKKKFILNNIKKLTKHHYRKSLQYSKILKFFNFKPDKNNNKIESFPFLPVRLFKYYELLSVKRKNVFKTLMSSGTSENILSKIFLDKENAQNQTKVLTKIMNSILGEKRLPMMIVEKEISKINRSSFNAKIAAINGFSVFGKEYTYIINQDDTINYDKINQFLKKFGDEPFFIFGFTYNIYNYLIKRLDKKKFRYNFQKGILLHGGGWKKMEKIKIDNEKFKINLNNILNLNKIYNYYGLIEQTGSIFIECQKCSCFITSIFSDVIIRDKHMKVLPPGQKGFIQLISILPKSYPGHIILTEDIGEIIENDCNCKNLGKRFKVHGRSEKSEIRGCSDI